MAELDERVPVEPDERDVATDGLVDERLGGRPEGLPLGEPDEPLELGSEVEERIGVVGCHEVVDECHRHPARLEPDGLLAVLVDAVVLTRLAGAAGLAMSDVGAGQILELERDVLGDVTRPRAVAQARDEASTAAERAGVVLERGQQRDQGVTEVRDQVGRVLFEHAQIDQQTDDRLARPVIRAPQDARLEDAQGRCRPAPGRAGGASASATRARREPAAGHGVGHRILR